MDVQPARQGCAQHQAVYSGGASKNVCVVVGTTAGRQGTDGSPDNRDGAQTADTTTFYFTGLQTRTSGASYRVIEEDFNYTARAPPGTSTAQSISG